MKLSVNDVFVAKVDLFLCLERNCVSVSKVKRKIASPLGRPRVLCKKDQGGSYPSGEGGGVGASLRGGIE